MKKEKRAKYEKPRVKSVELATEEVLSSGCRETDVCDVAGSFKGGGSTP